MTTTAPHTQATKPLVTVDQLVKYFPGGELFGGKNFVHSVDNVSFTIEEHETLGLVGESGSGKSTLARVLLGLVPASRGRVLFRDADVTRLSNKDVKALRRQCQIVFQDPHAALDPRMRIGASLEAPLAQHKIGTRKTRRQAVVRQLEKVGLDSSFVDRYPRECSGGQAQRVVIARALLLEPKFLVCDEPTSALDASIRAQILNLLVDLKNELGLTLLMISHDLRVVRHLCDRVAVMYVGEIVELAPTERLFEHPLHPYTRALMAASFPEEAVGGLGGASARGEPPSPIHPPSGCRFHTRCPLAQDDCRVKAPALTEVQPGHWVSCHHWHQTPDLSP